MKILSFFYGPTLDLENSSDKLLLMRLSLGLVEQKSNSVYKHSACRRQRGSDLKRILVHPLIFKISHEICSFPFSSWGDYYRGGND